MSDTRADYDPGHEHDDQEERECVLQQKRDLADWPDDEPVAWTVSRDV